MTAPAGQEEPVHLTDLHRALQVLPAERREALLLVGAGGFSYEEAAEICGCALGTIKSRVGRARATLNDMLSSGNLPDYEGTKGGAHSSILEELDRAVGSGPSKAALGLSGLHTADHNAQGRACVQLPPCHNTASGAFGAFNTHEGAAG